MRQCEFEQYEPSQIDTKKTILEQLLVMKSMMKNNFPTQQIFVTDKRVTQNMTTEDLTNINGRKVKVNDLIVFYNTNILEWGIVESIEENNLVIKDIGQISGGGNGDYDCFSKVENIRFLSDTATNVDESGIEYTGTVWVSEIGNDEEPNFQFTMQVPIVGSERVTVDLNEEADKIKISLSRNRLGKHIINISGTNTLNEEINISFSLLEQTGGRFYLIDSYSKLYNFMTRNNQVFNIGGIEPVNGYFKTGGDVYNAMYLKLDNEKGVAVVVGYNNNNNTIIKTSISLLDFDTSGVTYKTNIFSVNLGDE